MMTTGARTYRAATLSPRVIAQVSSMISLVKPCAASSGADRSESLTFPAPTTRTPDIADLRNRGQQPVRQREIPVLVARSDRAPSAAEGGGVWSRPRGPEGGRPNRMRRPVGAREPVAATRFGRDADDRA